ncbi:MAG: LacI family DNA-binding transcriptional regulator [Victivallales bacterium]|nr:LacI family DNA-binding transcriptional regulator [Victivallales bacterium]
MKLRSQRKVFTMNEIAAECGVSLSTVYRILRHPERGDTPIRRQVRAQLIQNGYLPEFHSDQSLTILNVIANGYYIHQSCFHFLLQKICLVRKINLVLCELESLERAVDRVHPSGLIYNVCPRSFHATLPSVIIHAGYNSSLCTSVGEDDVGGICALFAKLKSLGHRRIFYFSPDLYDDDQMFQDRFIPERAKRFYALNQLPFDESLLCFRKISVETHERVMREVVDYFLGLADRPTAIVAASDIYCEAFYTRLAQVGLRIPKDVSIAGFGHFSRYRQYIDTSVPAMQRAIALDPPLTTCDMPEELAEKAVDLLVEKIQNPLVRNRKLLIMPNLVLTRSIGRVPT